MSGAKRLRVVVTQEDIDKGVRADSETCALALALHRSGQSGVVLRGGWTKNWYKLRFGDGPWGPVRVAGPTAPLSTRANRFVRAFDFGRPVKPATFLLPLP